MKRSGIVVGNPVRSLFILACAVFLAAGLTAQGTAATDTSLSPSSNRQAAQSQESTPAKIASDYVTVVGGVVAALGTVFGLPLVYQTFRKTRVEIEKIELESEKLRSDLSGIEQGSVSGTDTSITISGDDNVVTVMTDPRYTLPFLVLTDALIAYIYYNVVSFAVYVLPLNGVLRTGAYLVLFIIIFFPVFRTARRVNKKLGQELGVASEPDPESA